MSLLRRCRLRGQASLVRAYAQQKQSRIPSYLQSAATQDVIQDRMVGVPIQKYVSNYFHIKAIDATQETVRAALTERETTQNTAQTY